MLKTLFFLLKLALFIGAIIWLSEQEGSVRIEWLGYTINAHVGLFLAGLLSVILFAIFIYRVIRAFVDFPASLRYYNLVKNKDKGYKALAIGLTAVAAGDTKVALKQADKAGARVALIWGEDEVAARSVTVRPLRGGEEGARQRTVPLEELEAALDTALAP